MIRAEHVRVTFRKGFRKKRIVALDDFNLQIEKGDIFALLGPNGAGKSTAMYCLLGLIRPEAGTVTINGQQPVPGGDLYSSISYVPEEPHYHLYLTVEEALKFYGSLYGSPVPTHRLNAAMERLGLTEHRDLRLDKCSKGMKQKMGLATCLLHDSQIVFLDEPTRGLDPVIVHEFREIILEMNRNGVTFVMNSHVLSEVEQMCNRVAIMEKGKVVVQEELKLLLAGQEEGYVVSFDAAEALPEFASLLSTTDGRMKARIPTDAIDRFFLFTRERNLKVYDCALKSSSLEDAFLKLVRAQS